jgi:hypothetical protein
MQASGKISFFPTSVGKLCRPVAIFATPCGQLGLLQSDCVLCGFSVYQLLTTGKCNVSLYTVLEIIPVP